MGDSALFDRKFLPTVSRSLLNFGGCHSKFRLLSDRTFRAYLMTDSSAFMMGGSGVLDLI